MSFTPSPSSPRYDAALHSPSPRGTPARLKSSNSYGSLARTDSYSRRQRSMRRGSAGSISGFKKGDDDGGAPIEEEQEDEDEYGKPIETAEASLLIGTTKAPSSSGSLSPIISDDQAIGEGEGALTADFPFSINHPPRIPREGDINDVNPSTISVSTGVSAKVPDNRYRGDSSSSVKITDNQDYLKGNHTASKMTDVAPPKSPEVPPSGAEVVDAGNEIRRSQYSINYPTTNVPGSLLSPQSQPPQHQQSPPLDLDSRMAHTSSHTLVNLTPSSTLVSKDLSGCKTLGIDISSISTHAQAEALAEHLSQQVMEFVCLDEQELEFEPGQDGRTPLSARLAAYGESLALARRLKELEDGGGSVVSGVTARSALMNEESIGADASAMNLALPVAHNPSDNSEHSGSLYGTRSVGGLKGMPSPRSVGISLNGVIGHQKKSPRPSSAEGRKLENLIVCQCALIHSSVVAPRDQNLSLSSELSFQSMQSIVSASALGCQADKTPPRQQPIPMLSISDAEDDSVRQPPVPIQSFITRSHTPVNERGAEHKAGISRMTSLDGMAYVDDKFGEALCRVSTAPSQAPRLPPGRSAKKLSKMGISVVDQAGINMAAPHVAASSAKRFKLKSLFRVGKP